MNKHPSRYLVIGNKKTGEKFRLDPTDMPVPKEFHKVTSTIPAPEKYWVLPIYKTSFLNRERMIRTMDGCKGYSTRTEAGTEYDCEYEFSGEVACEDCIFGPYEGKIDPRKNPDEEDKQ